MGSSRRVALQRLAALSVAGRARPANAQAMAWPRQPVRLLVGASPGGAPDAMARLMARLLQDLWGQPLVIDNRPGAAGLLAAEMTATAPADGHVLGLLLDSVIVNQPLVLDKLPLDPGRDLRPVTLVGTFPLILVAHPAAGFRTLRDVLAVARAHPGQIDYGSSGVGSTVHLAMEVLQRSAGVKLSHVPYKGGIPALQDVLAGHIPLMWSSITAALPLLQADRLVALGMGSAERFVLLPQVPTIAEQGYPGYTAGNWVGLFGPRALPDGVAHKIQMDCALLLRNAAYRDALLALGIEPQAPRSEDFVRQIAAEYQAGKAVLGSIGLGLK